MTTSCSRTDFQRREGGINLPTKVSSKKIVLPTRLIGIKMEQRLGEQPNIN